MHAPKCTRFYFKNIITTTLEDNTFTMVRRAHMPHAWSSSFVPGSNSRAEIKPHFMCKTQIALNCAMKPGPQSAHAGPQLCERPARLLKTGFLGASCVQACTRVYVCMYVCVRLCVQEIKNSLAPQPAAGGLLEAGEGTSSPGWSTPPKALWETGRS